MIQPNPQSNLYPSTYSSCLVHSAVELSSNTFMSECTTVVHSFMSQTDYSNKTKALFLPFLVCLSLLSSHKICRFKIVLPLCDLLETLDIGISQFKLYICKCLFKKTHLYKQDRGWTEWSSAGCEIETLKGKEAHATDCMEFEGERPLHERLISARLT